MSGVANQEVKKSVGHSTKVTSVASVLKTSFRKGSKLQPSATVQSTDAAAYPPSSPPSPPVLHRLLIDSPLVSAPEQRNVRQLRRRGQGREEEDLLEEHATVDSIRRSVRFEEE